MMLELPDPIPLAFLGKGSGADRLGGFSIMHTLHFLLMNTTNCGMFIVSLCFIMSCH